MAAVFLPEEVVDHVDHFAAPRIHQKRIVVIAHPAVRRVGVGQAVHPRLVDPVARPVIVRVQPRADAPAVIAPAERVDVQSYPEDAAIAVAVAPPVVAPIIAPAVAVPAPMTAATPPAIAAAMLGR